MMHRRLGWTAIAAAVLAAAAIAVPGSGAARAAAQGCGGTGAVTTATGTLRDGATYLIQCPPGRWNGTLFLYSHGYVQRAGPTPRRT